MKKIIIETPLNTMGFSYERETNLEWLHARLDTLRKYVIPSLANQTNKDFYWHLIVREETKKFIIDNLKSDLYNSSPNFYLVDVNENQEQINMHALEINPGVLYLTRLNSDDLYHPEFIERVHNYITMPQHQALVYQYGYMWYQDENILVEREIPSPPFYSYIYNTEDYLKGFRYDVAGHNHVRIVLKTIAERERNWLWIVNKWCNKIQRGSAYPDPKEFKQVDLSILKEFGIEEIQSNK